MTWKTGDTCRAYLQGGRQIFHLIRKGEGGILPKWSVKGGGEKGIQERKWYLATGEGRKMKHQGVLRRLRTRQEDEKICGGHKDKEGMVFGRNMQHPQGNPDRCNEIVKRKVPPEITVKSGSGPWGKVVPSPYVIRENIPAKRGRQQFPSQSLRVS